MKYHDKTIQYHIRHITKRKDHFKLWPQVQLFWHQFKAHKNIISTHINVNTWKYFFLSMHLFVFEIGNVSWVIFTILGLCVNLFYSKSKDQNWCFLFRFTEWKFVHFKETSQKSRMHPTVEICLHDDMTSALHSDSSLTSCTGQFRSREDAYPENKGKDDCIF